MKNTIIILASLFAFSAIAGCKESEEPRSQLPCDTKICDKYRVVVKPSALARESPSVNSPVITEIPHESTVSLITRDGPKDRLLGLDGQWWQVQYERQVAWIFSRLLVPRHYAFEGFRVQNGEAIFNLPSKPKHVSPAGRALSLQHWEHHYGEHCVYFFSEDLTSARVDCCSAGSGPPLDSPANRPNCEEKTVKVSGDKDELTIQGLVFKWEPRLGGYLPQDGTDWDELIQQAFLAKPSPEGYDQNYEHFPEGCIFCVHSCLGGGFSYLCDLGENENPMRERQRSFDQMFGKPENP